MPNHNSRHFVVYHFYDRDELYRDNLAHFLLFGITENVDYLFVVQGDGEIPPLSLPNAEVMKVPNHGLDFGGIRAAIMSGAIPVDRERYFFVNSSVRGPFVPAWLQHDWTRAFDIAFEAGFDLVGTTEHTGGGDIPQHVQSSSYALSGAAFTQLLERGFFAGEVSGDKQHIIRDYEIGLTQEIERMGLQSGVLVNSRTWHGTDWWYNPTSRDGDGNYRDAFFGTSLNPFHAVFPKVNRKIYSVSYLDNLTASLIVTPESSSLRKIPLVDSYLTRLEHRRSRKVRHAQRVRALLDFLYRFLVAVRALLKR